MKIFKKQIPVRHILYVVLGWLHATMLCTPLYALVLNFVSEGMTKDVILQNILRGFLILAPITLSWFAIKCLRRIFFYILASIGITVLTGFLFDSVLMAVVALFICFMRLYGRLHGESYSLFDHAGYADLAVFAVPFLCSVFTDRADLIFQPVSLVFAAVYFVLCLTQRGIRRIDDYIDVNAAMQNMPARRIVRITCALLAAAAVFCTAVLLPPLLTSDIGYRYTPREAIHAEYTPPEQTETSPGGNMPLDEMIPAAEPSPVLVLIMKILEYIVLIALAGGLIFGVIYGCIRISRGFKTSFVDRRDLVENLPEDERTTVRERAQKRDRPDFLDRSPTAAPQIPQNAAACRKRAARALDVPCRSGSPREAPKRCPAHRLRKSPVQRKRLYKRRPHRNISCTKRTAHGTRKTAAMGCFILYISVQAGAVCECTERSVRSSSNRTVQTPHSASPPKSGWTICRTLPFRKAGSAKPKPPSSFPAPSPD